MGGGDHESFSSGNVLTSLKYVIIEHENFELIMLQVYRSFCTITNVIK